MELKAKLTKVSLNSIKNLGAIKEEWMDHIFIFNLSIKMDSFKDIEVLKKF